MFTLSNDFTRFEYMISVIGCGGTGGFVAEGLCRLLPEGARLLLVDHDRVEEANLVRQNFTHDDLGELKSEALAKRLSSKFRRPISYSTLPISMLKSMSLGVIIGCVDNGLARKEIAEFTTTGYGRWWIDAGNGENYGQVLIGNATEVRDSFNLQTMVCGRLPLPSIQGPELLLQQPPRRACAEAMAAGEQGPVINQVMAVLVLEMMRKLIDGTLSWMQVYVDLESGTLSTVQATPEIVSRITGVTVKKLVRGGEHEQRAENSDRAQG